MASYTPNLGLIKPAGSDNVAVQQLNTNMDVLDREVHENTERIDRIRVAAPPYIDSTTKHWMVYDPETGAYEDSGVVAEAKGPYINETNGDWMIWDDVNLRFVDSGIVAVGHPASMTANATTLPAGSSATASVTGTPENPVLNIGVPRGNTGDAAGFATPTATVDANVGTPSVTVTATGPDTAKQFAFEFHNLKGRDGTIGYTPDIHIGTVESVPEGAQAEVTRTGTDEDPYLNFKLPRSGAGIGFYPIDFTIAVAGWTYDSTEQRYKHEHSDNTINTRMRIVEWYIQDWDLMLGATDLIIASGKVTVWTDTIPTAAWNMHVDFATDGSEVLDELGDIDDRVDTLEGTVSTQSDQIANVEISNEYSSILDAVNAYKSIKAFPFTIQKNGNSVFTDLPTEMSNTDEWNLLCYGSQSRTTLILSRYTQADATYIRTMFNGSYIMSNWLGFADDDQIVTLGNKVSNNNDAYSSSKAYAIGDLVIYDNVLYRCTTACSAASWDVNQSCFTSDTLTNAIKIVNTNVNPFVISRNILRGVDLNNVRDTGFYWLNGNITNGLEGANYGILLVFAKGDSNGDIKQIHLFADSNNLGIRSFHNNWIAWKRFTLAT